MGLLLVRHSDAAPAAQDVDDNGRWLTAEGRAKAEAVARRLLDKGLKISLFVTSPHVRAVQTAEIFARVLEFRGAVTTLASLSYTVPARNAARQLSALSGNVAAFGHMPTLAETAQLLCASGPAPQGFSPSQAIWIEGGRFQWSLTPES